MDYSNIRIVNQPLDPALGWTTINQGPNSIQVPPPRPPFSGPGMENNQGTPPPPSRPPFSGPGMGNNQGTPPPPPRPPFSGPGMGNNQGTPPSPPPSFTPKKKSRSS